MKLQSAIWKLEKKIDLTPFAKAVHRKLGIFIDIRCQFPENIRSAFDEVRFHRKSIQTKFATKIYRSTIIILS